MSPSAPASGDFNGDGFTDLAVGNSGGNNVFIDLGNAAGQFGQGPGTVFSFDVATAPAALLDAGDLNNDGGNNLLARWCLNNGCRLPLVFSAPHPPDR